MLFLSDSVHSTLYSNLHAVKIISNRNVSISVRGARNSEIGQKETISNSRFEHVSFLYRNNTESFGILSNLVETYRIPVNSNVEIDFRSEEFPKCIRPLENCVISISGHVLWIKTSFEKTLWCH